MTATWTFDDTDQRLLAAFSFWIRRGYNSLTTSQLQVALDADPAMDTTVHSAVQKAIEHTLIDQIAARSYQLTQAFLDTTYDFGALGETLFGGHRGEFGLI